MKASELIKTEGIIKASPDDTISSVISKMQSSHDAAFIFNSHYMGVLNPYYSLIKHNTHNGDSLVKSAVYHPPRIEPNDSVERIVGLMVDSRLHYLPVMEGKTFHGVVSARRILAKNANSAVFDKTILEALQFKKKPLVSVYQSDEISKVINLFETEDVSKLVVIDSKMKLQGIMSYYDLVPHLLAPTRKMDPREMTNFKNLDAFAGLTVKNVAKTLVHTLTPDATLKDALNDIVKRSIGSVVIVNREGFPVGIITVRDLLHFLTRTESEPMIELSTNSISEQNMDLLYSYGPKLERWVKKMPDLARATMLVKEEKNGKLFKVTLNLIPKKGKSMIFTEEGKNLLEVLQKINKKKVLEV